MNRIPTLDGWRGVAILIVLTGHFSGWVFVHEPLRIARIGQHGVAIFFVISGFLITSLLDRERVRTGSINLRRFYLRRFFRLMPCAWCYLAAVALLAITARVNLLSVKEVLGCIFFFRNYVGPGESHIFTAHFWSLSIEEQFYLFWPSALVLLGARRSRWLAVAAAAVVAAWRLQHWAVLSGLPFTSSTLTQYRADALFAGCAAALAMRSVINFLRPWMAVPLLAGVMACAVRNPSLVPLHESIMIALLLMITSSQGTFLSGLLEWKPLAFIGTISYSIYLWQELFTIFAGQGALPLIVTLPALAGLSVGSYYWIEQPMIRLGRRMEEREPARVYAP